MKKSSKVVALLLAFVLAFSLGFSSPVSAAGVKVKKIVVKNSLTDSTKSVIVAKGKTVKLKTTVTVTPNSAANKKLTFTSANPKVATVNAKGVVKGVAAGKTKIVVASAKDPKKKTSIAVTVKASAVTTLTIAKPASKKIYTGSTLKLKANVGGASSAYKSVQWSSSNPKVASVSKSGVVKAIKPGSVKITVKSLDGSNRKASIALTIQNKPVDIVSASVLNAQTVTFKLSGAKALTAADIQVFTKQISTGTYRYQLTVDNISTADNVNYTVVLSDSTRVGLRKYVQVSIPSLTGVKSIETQYNEAAVSYDDEYVVTLLVNEPISSSGSRYYNDDDWYYDSRYGLYFGASEGYYSQTVSGLPAGINYRIKNNAMYLYGTPTATGVTVATYTAVDEVGNTITRKIKFVIGSSSVLSSGSATRYCIATKNSSYYANINVIGGSGSYKYEFAPGTSTYGCEISGSQVRGNFEIPGTYNINVLVTDYENDKLTTTATVTFVVKQGISLAGIITDLAGNPITNARIYLTNKNKADNYTSSYSTYTDDKGAFSANINAGTYDVEASYSEGSSENSSATRYLYAQALTASKSGYDIQLPLYKVKFSLPTDITTSNISYWKDAFGDTYGYGDSIYVKPGTYSLEADVSQDWYQSGYKKVKSTFTVTNQSIFASVTTEGSVDVPVVGSITIDKAVSGSVEGKPTYRVYSFKATENCTIKFTDNSSTYRDKCCISVYNKTTKSYFGSITYSGDTFNVNAGDEFLVEVYSYDGYSSYNYNFTLTKYVYSEE